MAPRASLRQVVSGGCRDFRASIRHHCCPIRADPSRRMEPAPHHPAMTKETFASTHPSDPDPDSSAPARNTETSPNPPRPPPPTRRRVRLDRADPRRPTPHRRASAAGECSRLARLFSSSCRHDVTRALPGLLRTLAQSPKRLNCSALRARRLFAARPMSYPHHAQRRCDLWLRQRPCSRRRATNWRGVAPHRDLCRCDLRVRFRGRAALRQPGHDREGRAHHAARRR